MLFRSSMKHPLSNRRNEILCSFEFVNEIADFLDVNAKYFLKSPDMFEDFAKELKAKGLDDVYEPVTDSVSYKKIVEPVENLSSITTLFIIVVLVLGSIILILLNTMSIRERKYEIGVLRAIGMKKAKVAIGIVTESFVITAVCLVIGLGIGAVVAKPISNSMLNKQMKIYNEQKEDMWDMMDDSGQANTENDDVISQLDVIIDANTVAKVSGISVILVLISSLVGVAYITRFEPVKILTERG